MFGRRVYTNFISFSDHTENFSSSIYRLAQYGSQPFSYHSFLTANFNFLDGTCMYIHKCLHQVLLIYSLEKVFLPGSLSTLIVTPLLMFTVCEKSQILRKNKLNNYRVCIYNTSIHFFHPREKCSWTCVSSTSIHTCICTSNKQYLTRPVDEITR